LLGPPPPPVAFAWERKWIEGLVREKWIEDVEERREGAASLGLGRSRSGAICGMAVDNFVSRVIVGN
jgi:hypothetical protein